MMLTYKYVDKDEIIEINDKYTEGINSIIRLDKQFTPLYGTIIETLKIEYINRKDDEFVALFEFENCNGIIYNKCESVVETTNSILN